MEDYKRRLLSHLQQDETQQKDVPLANVKKSMGQLGLMPGNPLTKTEITLTISLYYLSDVDSHIPPSSLPVTYRISWPIYLFGLTDYYGGFNAFTTINPIRSGWEFQAPLDPIYMGIWGLTLFRIGIGPAFDSLFDRGDLVYMFRPNVPGAPMYTTIVKIHCNNVAYGTFLNSFVSDLITINSLRYIVPIANVNQFINPFIFGYQTLFGKLSTDTIDPRMYITSTDFQQQICDLPLNFPIDKAALVGFQCQWDNDFSQIILFVEKVEPLTNRRKIR